VDANVGRVERHRGSITGEMSMVPVLD
jgi:hypothetical protein